MKQPQIPVFTIIIPVYNVAPYLRECLDSIAAQTFKDWECICVDDGSTDGSGTILDEYAEKDGRFKIVHQKNAGVSAARNTALEKATGEFFFFVDGDDAIVPDALECFDRTFRETSADGILCHPSEAFIDIGEIGVAPWGSAILAMTERPVELLCGRFAAHGYVASRVYRCSTFGRMRFPTDVCVTEDARFWIEALCVPAKWAVMRKLYYAYRKRGDSASAMPTWDLYRDCLKTMAFAFRMLHGPLHATQKEIRRYSRQFRHAHHYIFIRAFRLLASWADSRSNEFTDVVDDVFSAASPVRPFFHSDIFRHMGLKYGIPKTADSIARIFDRLH